MIISLKRTFKKIFRFKINKDSSIGFDKSINKNRLIVLIQIVLLILIFFQTFSFWFNWVSYNYFLDKPIEILSFRSIDPSWMPAPYTSLPILGVHHFGDFNLYYGWGKVSDFSLINIFNDSNNLNPYISFDIIANYPPFSILFFEFFTIFNLKISYFLFILATNVFIFYTCMNLLKEIDVFYRLLIYILAIPLSLPFLVTVDRGNIQVIILLLLLIYYMFLFKGKPKIAELFIFIASWFKLYPIFISLLTINKNNINYKLKLLIISFFVNLFLFLLLPGDFLLTIKNFLNSNNLFFGANSENIFSGLGIVSIISRISLLFSSQDEITNLVDLFRTIPLVGNFILWIPGFIYLIIVMFCLFFNKLPFWVNQVLILSSIQMVPPFVFNYVTIWVNVAFVIFFASISQKDFKFNKMNILFLILFINILVCNLISFPGRFTINNNIVISINNLLSSASITVFFTASFIYSVFKLVQSYSKNQDKI